MERGKGAISFADAVGLAALELSDGKTGKSGANYNNKYNYNKPVTDNGLTDNGYPVNKKEGVQGEKERTQNPLRRNIVLTQEAFFSGEYDPVDLAIAVTGGGLYDRNLWRWYLRNGKVAKDLFVELAYEQWRENLSDGSPRHCPSAFQARLNRVVKGGAR